MLRFRQQLGINENTLEDLETKLEKVLKVYKIKIFMKVSSSTSHQKTMEQKILIWEFKMLG